MLNPSLLNYSRIYRLFYKYFIFNSINNEITLICIIYDEGKEYITATESGLDSMFLSSSMSVLLTLR